MELAPACLVNNFLARQIFGATQIFAPWPAGNDCSHPVVVRFLEDCRAFCAPGIRPVHVPSPQLYHWAFGVPRISPNQKMPLRYCHLFTSGNVQTNWFLFANFLQLFEYLMLSIFKTPADLGSLVPSILPQVKQRVWSKTPKHSWVFDPTGQFGLCDMGIA